MAKFGPARRSLEERFWPKVDVRGDDECWPWLGAKKPYGYGQINSGGNGPLLQAHRVAYEFLVGPIPEGLVIDHLCENPGCVNPAHLEPVTNQDNMLRFHGQRTTCRHGHPLDGLTHTRNKGVYALQRYCKTCRKGTGRAA